MKDYIISFRENEKYALIEYNRVDKFYHYYEGVIIESYFPERITSLIEERNGIIDDMAISLLDEVEAKLYSYHIGLKENGSLIFDIEIIDGDKISFFTKYPSSQGYLDRYPGS
ncbi:hypothetical protein [Pectobacterium parmentieri]|uniref:hypothetical protein n=1 Tax=Pectobacterium parmentieri TaxID=1905730 RepID=UPI000CDCE3AB|nr:hypothetical protein [Pectobacterium parmentieri]AYH04269.1 hypothetical protein C5E25_02050 [Pectobacterium parmentieri]AYH13090.1 hypothetical protein C5E23_02035 [Pectobacterium parmentieri]AYH21792.1 hypothetical protein C5E21_02030 [Pectobacterium parmentieri]MBN3180297.1 hypothetical protein [Pectobacterium parmentieri]POW23630.1 hypothetical protein PB20LOC_04367 [Pectobacterium parmentieri]